MLFRAILIFIATCFILHSNAQQVQLNELMSSNTRIFDEEGDTPDWFELYNPSGQAVELSGWTVTDKRDNPGKWPFPDAVLEADEYLLVWASGKDKDELGFSRTLITQGEEFRYLLPIQAVDNQWTEVGFDDSTWNTGSTGIGYGDADDVTQIPQGTRSVFLRKTFSIADVNAIQELIFDVDYDDGFVAYINGTEIARANVNGFPPAYNALALTDREATIYSGGLPERFRFSNPGGLLLQGENVLCIQAHNISTTSSDFSIIPFLSAVYSETTIEGIAPPDLLKLEDQLFHTNFKISAEDETLYLFDNNGNLIDSLYAGGLPSNISMGVPLGGGALKLYDHPTPGFPNDTPGYDGFVDESIVFSHQGGLINSGSIQLTLSGVSAPYEIHYTLNATEPTLTSPIYSSPLFISSNTVIRAKVFRNGYLPSPSQNKTYLFGVSHDLPVISLVTEPANFYDNENGIYVLGDDYEFDYPHFGANFWQDWERPVHFSFYETDGTLGTSFNAGVKIFGGWSRASDQRSLSIFARKQYGTDEIDYPLFPDLPYENFQAIVLRNSGNDWNNTMLRDGALTGLMHGSGLDYQAFRPAVTYLNGEYWGFYNMREKVNEHFLASKHNLDPDEIDILEGEGITIHGDNQDYQSLINFVSGNNLSSEANYQYVAGQMDIENFIIYQVAQIYFDNTDWPGNNIKFWRPKTGKWKWILYDTDFGFGIWDASNYSKNTLAFALQSNGPGWPNPPWSTLLFRRLVQNVSFRNDFVNRFADELNSRFLPPRVQQRIDTLANNISTEINAHYFRWGGNAAFWSNQVSNMKNFAALRPLRVKQHILSVFNLPAFHKVFIQNNEPEKGFVRVNRLTIKESNWSGDYFEEVPIKVIAVPEPGFSFSHWSGDSFSTNAEININMKSAMTLKPHFISSEGEDVKIVVNEINYQSSETLDTDDWIELYNPNTGSVNLSGWELKSSVNAGSFTIPDGTLLNGNGFLVIASDEAKFKSNYPELENIIGSFGFDLSADNDIIKVYNKSGNLKDSVAYQSTPPWPDHANGTGATLELIEPSLDNALPESWASLNENGSPGISNQFSPPPFSGENIEDLKFYPNPFIDEVTISFCVKKETSVRINLYDMKGALIYSLFDGELETGEYRLEENFESLSRGIYLLEFVEGDNNKTVMKWVKGN